MPKDSEYDPAAMRERDAQQKLKMTHHAESKRAVRVCDIQVGETVLVKQPKHEKQSTPINPNPMTVTSKKHSVPTAESQTQKVTCKSLHFKKFLQQEHDITTNEMFEGTSSELDRPGSPSMSVLPKEPSEPQTFDNAPLPEASSGNALKMYPWVQTSLKTYSKNLIKTLICCLQ